MFVADPKLAQQDLQLCPRPQVLSPKNRSAKHTISPEYLFFRCNCSCCWAVFLRWRARVPQRNPVNVNRWSRFSPNYKGDCSAKTRLPNTTKNGTQLNTRKTQLRTKRSTNGSRKYRKRRTRTAQLGGKFTMQAPARLQPKVVTVHPVASALALSLMTSWLLLQNRAIRHSLYQVCKDAHAWLPKEWLPVCTNCQ